MRSPLRALSLVATLGMPGAASAVTFEWVAVGDPGNACDDAPAQGCFGAVEYHYSIAKHEVTNAQYAEFLNAKAASDPLGLYNPDMAWSGGILRSGAPGSYTYAPGAGRGSKPVVSVSYFDAQRFANWLHNGQGNGDTETGAYTLLGGTPTPSNMLVERNPGATVFVPTEDEWYKAAYYDPASQGWFHYPTGNNALITCSGPSAAANAANCNSAAGDFTDVGSYPHSRSPSGTLDQGGNVAEWNDAVVFMEMRPTRGGHLINTADRLQKAMEEYDDPWFESGVVGFRVASFAPGAGCGDGTCDAGETPATCSDDCPCAGNAECDDGQFCNGVEQCDGGTCEGGPAVDCGDGVGCTNDACDEAANACVRTPQHALCNNGLFCDGVESCHATLGCQPGSTPCPGLACNEANDACVGGPEVWVSFNAPTNVPGVGVVGPEDIVARNVTSGTWSMVLDGSDVGLAGRVIDGFARRSDGHVLLSFDAATTIAGLSGGPSGTSVDDSDLVRFVPVSLGNATAGSFVFAFDGSDVGLTTDAEDIDAVALTATGQIIISTAGAVSANGANGADADLLRFTATSLGSVTAGSFVVHFDGSDVGLSDNSEDLDGADMAANGSLLYSTISDFSVPGVSAADEDLARFTPGTFGPNTAGAHSMYLDLSNTGISINADVNALDLVE